ncbi:MAG TPA: DNA-formamidopyrimidine glycosylase family protein [Mycobacteriales bacterium]|nr:DNA-formamidopyrimidine glycosylase family protein [Mycobacteriales bacterium]
MPEGDTVWLAARRLDEVLAGQRLVHTDFRVPQLATASLSGQTVVGVVSRGKHLLLRTDAGLTLHTHFRMDGTWRIFRRGSPWSGGPDFQVRVVLRTDEWDAVGYRLPVVELLPTEREGDVVGHLGPDLLGADWDESEATRRLGERPDREVGPALLDQRNLAGIGNLYKTETLFLSGITPWARVGDVADLNAVVRRAHRLMSANKGHWQQSTTGSLRRGEQHWVFERANRPCRRCGASVREAMQGELERPEQARICYWCGRCQTGPGPDGSAAAS